MDPRVPASLPLMTRHHGRLVVWTRPCSDCNPDASQRFDGLPWSRAPDAGSQKVRQIKCVCQSRSNIPSLPLPRPRWDERTLSLPISFRRFLRVDCPGT